MALPRNARTGRFASTRRKPRRGGRGGQRLPPRDRRGRFVSRSRKPGTRRTVRQPRARRAPPMAVTTPAPDSPPVSLAFRAVRPGNDGEAWGPQRPSAIAMLREDHRRLRQLVRDLARAPTGSGREGILGNLDAELKVHAQLEDEIFYPAFRAAAVGERDRRMYHEALEEHDIADRLIDDLWHTEPASNAFAGRARVLRHELFRHMRQEERQMLARARRLMGKAKLEGLGRALQLRRRELAVVRGLPGQAEAVATGA